MKLAVAFSILVLALAPAAYAQGFEPLPPLEDGHLTWLVGEWTGTTESSMGKTKDWMKFEMGIDGQFLLMHYKAESDMGTFMGMGAMTVGADGNIKGVWFDNWRNISTGSGSQDGKTMRMTWEGPMGKQVRVMKRVDDDHYFEDMTLTGSGGMEMRARTEMKRVK